MKKSIILLLLCLSFFGYSQQETDYEKYNPKVAWKTWVNNVQFINTDTFTVEVAPIDDDPGAFPLKYGNWLADVRNFRYKIVDTTSAPTLTVVDVFKEGYGPFQGAIGYVYLSAGNGNSPGLPTFNFEQMEEDALKQGYGRDMSIIWDRIDSLVPYNGAIQYVDLDTFGLGAGFFQLDTNYVSTGNEPTGTITWSQSDRTISIHTGLGPVIQSGQEEVTIVWNNTGSTLLNGKVVTPTGGIAPDGNPYVKYALADPDNFAAVEAIVVLTQDIEDGEWGFATLRGKVRGANTSGYTPGIAWLSTTSPGDLQSTKPEFPDYPIRIGGVLTSDPVNGVILVSRRGGANDSYFNFWNGTFRETFDFKVVSDGTTVKGYIEPSNGHPNLTMQFSDGKTILTTTPADTVTLIHGSDTFPQTNYVYIKKANKILEVSGSDFPEEEHIKVAKLAIAAPATAVTEKGLMNQNINDPIENTTTFQGHLSHITDKLRQGYADWKSGCEGSSTTGANIYFSTTGGWVYQMHRQQVEALSMPTDYIRITNDFLHPNRRVNNLVTYTTNAIGDPMNNTSFSIVYWVLANKTGEPSHLMCNYPTGGYSKNFPEQAVADGQNYSVYDIPADYKSVGFLVARATYVISGGVWTLIETENLRGKVPNTTAGGGAGGGQGATTYLGLTDTPSSFVAEAFQRVNSTGTDLENVLASAIQLTEFDTTGFKIPQYQVIDLGDTINQLRSEIIANEVDYGAVSNIPFINATGDGFNYDDGFDYAGGILDIPSGGGTPSQGRVRLGVVDVAEFASTGTPPSGRGYYFFKAFNSHPYAINDAGVEFDLTEGSGGTVTSVSSLTTDQLTVANGTTTPQLSIVTNPVINGGLSLATGDQIYDFVIGQDYVKTVNSISPTSGNVNIGLSNLNDYSTTNSITTGGYQTSGTVIASSLTATTVNSIRRDVDNSNFQIHGGSAFNKGSAITLYGEDSSTSPGSLALTHGGAVGTGDLNSKIVFGYRSSAGSYTQIGSIDKSGNLDIGVVALTNGTLGGEAMTRTGIEALITGGTEDADFNSLTLPTGETVNEFSSDSLMAGKSSTALVTEGAIVSYINSHGTPVQTLTETAGAVSWDMSKGLKAKVTIDETTVITITNMKVGAEATIRIVQGDSGDDNVTFVLSGATVEWRGDDQDLTDASGGVDYVSLANMDGILGVTLGSNYVTQ